MIDGDHLWEGSQSSIEFFVDQGWEHFADLTWDHLSDHAGDLGLKIDFWREEGKSIFVKTIISIQNFIIFISKGIFEECSHAQMNLLIACEPQSKNPSILIFLYPQLHFIFVEFLLCLFIGYSDYEAT